MTIPEESSIAAVRRGANAAVEPGRRRRPELERTQPIRFAAGYFRHPEPRSKQVERTPGKPADEGGAAMSSPEDVIVYGVRLGYKVAEEQVARGQAFARRLRSASLRSGSGDVGEVLGYVLELYKQIGTLLVEATETLGAGPRLLSQLFALSRGETPAPDKRRKSARGAAPQDLGAALGRLTDLLADKLSQGRQLTDDPTLKALIDQVLAGAGAVVRDSVARPSPSSAPAGGEGMAVTTSVISPRRGASIRVMLRERPKDPNALYTLALNPLQAGKAIPRDALKFSSDQESDEPVAAVTLKLTGREAPGRYFGQVFDKPERLVGEVEVVIAKGSAG